MLLITGAKGQLGTELKKVLPQAIAADAEMLDITGAEKVAAFVKDNSIDTVINCAAYTQVDRAEEQPEVAANVNEKGVYNLAKTGVAIIHISTDYVFDGMTYKPYTENDKTNPLSVYGKTKLNGEKLALENATTCLIIRTSWLYSCEGKNFVKTIMSAAKEKKKLSVVCDQVGTPTYAADLACAIKTMLPNMKKGAKEIYHYSNEGVCSWYDFAKEILGLAKIDCEVVPIYSRDYRAKAVRPYYSVLSKEKIKQHYGLVVPYWRESLIECLKQF